MRKQKKVIIIGSMINLHMISTISIDHKYLVKVRPFLAAETVDIFDYVKLIQSDLDPEAYVIHIGASDLTAERNTR